MQNKHADRRISVICPAKLNLTLAVGAPRADGLHPIASVMVTVGFGDQLTMTPSHDKTSRFTRVWHETAPRPTPIDWPIGSDLIVRAHAVMEQVADKPLPVEVALTKRVPVGAGLGGGSSDAAGVLLSLRRLFGLPIDDKQVLEVAGSLGADVVFAVHAMTQSDRSMPPSLGHKAALVTGTGDMIEPINSLPAFDALLIFPDGACPTGEVYATFDASDNTARPDSELAELADRWRHASGLPAPMNDLAKAAAKTCPPIEHAMQTLAAQGVQAYLTGSGSALFTIVGSQQHAVAIAESLANNGLAACPTSYLPLP
ncbi:MAG: hypothetical protein KTR15_09630 [Phycisphaeraceae bacterium]|nr:hypothetical protein [Phycisphaeraceae bacterium]